MIDNLPTEPNIPSHFIYEDKDGWRRTDKALTEQLNGLVSYGKTCQLAGRSFYPQWPKPRMVSCTRPAWRITPQGEVVYRWSWVARDHSKKHGNRCRVISAKRCGCKQPLRLRWDDQKQLWVQIEPTNKATEVEARRLDKANY